jgi:hypothetical protein
MIKHIKHIKIFNNWVTNKFIVEDTNQPDRITVKELIQIFNGKLPEQAFEFLISPTDGKTVTEIRNILCSIANGTYIAPIRPEAIILQFTELPVQVVSQENVKKKRVRKKA